MNMIIEKKLFLLNNFVQSKPQSHWSKNKHALDRDDNTNLESPMLKWDASPFEVGPSRRV